MGDTLVPPRRGGPPPRRGQQREDPDCPAEWHRHSRAGYTTDGCRCPSTLDAWQEYRRQVREGQARYQERHRKPPASAGQPAAREADPSVARVDLRKADRRDAEAIAMGYRLPRASIHTRAMAVRLMRQASPQMTDRQVAWKLEAAGQGRWVVRTGGRREYEPVNIRQVQRIQAALDWKRLNRPRRRGSRLDRSGRTE